MTNQPDYLDWLDQSTRSAGFDVITGTSQSRHRDVDQLVGDVRQAGLPVVRLDGNRSQDWAAQINVAVGPFALSFDVRHSPSGATGPAPTPPPTPTTPPTTLAPTPVDPHSGVPSASGTTAPGAPSPLDGAIADLARVAVARGGAVVAVDDLHRVPAEVRDALVKAVHDSGAPILVVGSSAPSHEPRLDRAGEVLNNAHPMPSRARAAASAQPEPVPALTHHH